jgi:hypothetical protein
MFFSSAILRQLFPIRTRQPLAAHRKASRRRARPRFELLEDRSLLSVSAGLWISGGAMIDEIGGYAVFTVGCTVGDDPVTVEYQTVDGSAASGSDYGATSGTLTFTSSSTTTVSVAIIDELLTEDDEAFSLELFNAVNAPIDIAQAEATILANDHPPLLDFIPDQTVDEEQELMFGAYAYDPDQPADTIAYSLDAGAPSGATIDPLSGTFTWLTEECHGPGTFTVTVIATEAGSGMSASQAVNITVNEVNEAPTTSGLADVNVDEDASGTTIGLWPAFDDAEDGASGLSYTIVDNSDPALFSSVTIDAAGQLHLSYAANAWGWAAITVRATDSGGLSVETTLSVNINPVNDAPVLTGFEVKEDSPGQWVISGHVTDVDEDISGCSVYFGGILAPYSISAWVDSFGDFLTLVELPGIQSGYAEAWAFDMGGLQSNVAVEFVTVLS